MPMSEFRPAVRTNTAIILALAGASGSGKTKSALELATGLAGPKGKILGIDSEGRRMLHYAPAPNEATRPGLYAFDHSVWSPPFTPDELLAALQQAEAAGYTVTIVDSASDEYEGEGGMQDMAAEELSKQREVRDGRGDGNSAAAWARPKAKHKKIIKWLRLTKMHVIFCLRAEEKIKIQKGYKDGKPITEIIQLGWIPICEKRFMFDMTASFLFTPDADGRGKPKPIKRYDKFAPFFPENEFVTVAAGKALAAWSVGAAPRDADLDALRIAGEKAAKAGTDEYTAWFQGIGPEGRRKVGKELHEDMKASAVEATGRLSGIVSGMAADVIDATPSEKLALQLAAASTIPEVDAIEDEWREPMEHGEYKDWLAMKAAIDGRRVELQNAQVTK